MAATMKPFVGALLLCATACSNAPESLVDRLREGMTESKVNQVLRVPPSSLRVLYQKKLAAGDPRPPYSEKTVEVGTASCVGVPSRIELSYYLEGLTSVACYPKDGDAMMNALVQKGIAKQGQREFQVRRGGVEVRGTIYRGRWSITFTSKRRRADQNAWIARYS